MLRATRTFITADTYAEIRVVKGRTHIADGSPLALSHPESFEPVPGRPPGARERVMSMNGGTTTMTTPPVRSDRDERLGASLAKAHLAPSLTHPEAPESGCLRRRATSS
jgi:hypothetical protein